jgi:hypothetical protein
MPPKRKRNGAGATGRGGGGARDLGKPTTDPRFFSMHTNPTFSRPKKQSNKVKIDERFQAVLTDERFRAAEGGKVDRYGRRREKKDNKEELDKFYHVDEEDADSGEEEEGSSKEEEEEEEEEEEGQDPEAHKKSSKVSRDDASADGRVLESGKPELLSMSRTDMQSRVDYLNKMARGELSGESSSEESDEESGVSDGLDGESSDDELDEPVPTGEESSRLAIQDCDWNNMKAVDLLALCSSFCPAGESIKKCTVYPSDYGLERFKKEERFGPVPFLKEAEERLGPSAGKASDGHIKDRTRAGIVMETEDQDGDGEGFNPEVLRAYEIQRRKYYFAIVDCGSKRAASAIYAEVDNMEFETSSIKLDLRFVPDDVSFAGRVIRDEASVVPGDYSVPTFIFKALQQSRVDCTWDEAEEDRKKLLPGSGLWSETKEEEFEAYIESSGSDDDSSDEEKTREKIARARKALLSGLVSDPEEGGSDDQESGTEENKEELDSPVDTHEVQEIPQGKGSAKNKGKGKGKGKVRGKGKDVELSAAENDDFFMEEDKEAEASHLEEVMGGEGEESARDYDMVALEREEKMKGKKLRGRRKRKEEMREPAAGRGFEVDVQDTRFAAVITGEDGRFGIDRTAPEFKETEGMRKILETQRKIRKESTGTVLAGEGGGHEALSSLVHRLKAKSKKR